MRNQKTYGISRRLFLRRASVSLAGLSALQVGLHGCAREGALPLASTAASGAEGAASTEGASSWSITMVSKDEPGTPLVVSGKIYASDGTTPLEGMTLYVYHTDARGFYSDRDGNGQPPQPRLKGWMRTDREGRYEFRTIRPASYPGSRNPAHIHSSVSGRGYPERWIPEFWFDDDPFVTAEMRAPHAARGRFSPIMSVTRGADGLLRGTRDIKL